MARIWLDYHAEKTRVQMAKIYSQLGNNINPFIKNAFRDASRDALKALRHNGNMAPANCRADIHHDDIMSRLSIAALPFTLTRSAKNYPIAIAIEGDAVRDLREGDITDNIHHQGLELMAEHGVAYIDLAQHSFLMCDGRLQLRAIFVHALNIRKLPWSPLECRFIAIFSKPGENGNSNAFSWCDLRTMVVPSLPCMNSQERTCRLVNEAYPEPQEFFRLLEDFVWNTLVHYQASRDVPANSNEKRSGPPNNRKVALNDNQRPNVAEEFQSLFEIVRMSRLGTEAVKIVSKLRAGGKRKPFKKHWVPGFWATRHYGPGRKLSRKVFIDTFQRGDIEVEPKVKLNLIKRVDLNVQQELAAA